MAKPIGAPGWRKERKRRRRRRERIFKQEARRPHFQIVYRIGADGNPIDQTSNDRTSSTMGPVLVAPWDDLPELTPNG